MGKLFNEYVKLRKKADNYYNKHETKCSNMLELLQDIVEIDLIDENCSVINQTGDGYVLLNNYGKNIPVSKIIEQFERTRKILSLEELNKLGI